MTVPPSGIALRGLEKRYGDVTAVHALDLDVTPGELLVLLGPSGCGKSTLLRLIAGLEEPTAGDIEIGGRRVNDLAPGARDVAMVFQSYALYPHMSVARNLGFGLESRRMPKDEVSARVSRAAQALDLEELLDRRPGQLSGGQQQRVALGRALVRQPGVFLLDEPLSNLDAGLRLRTRDEIAALHRRLGTTMLFVTHDQMEAMSLGHRIAIMRDGSLQQIGTPEEIYGTPANLFIATFIGTPPINQAPLSRGDEGRLEAGPFRFSGSWSFDAGTLAVRPEDLRVSQDGEEPDAVASVVRVEPLGSEHIVHMETPMGAWTMRVSPSATVTADDELPISVDWPRAHVFDDEGNRWGPPPRPGEDGR